ncbi:MAG: sugar phosphate isomerase/epimerase [Firmicutes bacterium]|nr:sugar phosphate isomerase/epimerase [Bacillota bacterium]
MKIGFLNAALMHWSPEQLLAFAGEHHFDAVELHAGPGSWDVIWSQAAHGDISRIRRLLERYNLECAGLMYGQLPFLSIDPKERDNAQRYLLMLLNVAHALGIPVVSTFAGRRLGENWAGNVAIFQEVFTPLVATAERLGVKIGLENCPMTHGFEPITNIAYAPAVWDLLFEAVPSRALGLTLDPSHLAWLGIDPTMVVRQYGEKIVHVHARTRFH